MKRQCILTGVQFDTKDMDTHICPEIADRIVNIVAVDKGLQRRVSAEILGDAEAMKEIAKQVLNVRASDVGLSYPGTISEFFLKLRDKRSN